MYTLIPILSTGDIFFTYYHLTGVYEKYTLLAGEFTMEKEGSKRVDLAGLGDKHQITATFAAPLNGQFLPMQLLYQGKTDCRHPKLRTETSKSCYTVEH